MSSLLAFRIPHARTVKRCPVVCIVQGRTRLHTVCTLAHEHGAHTQAKVVLLHSDKAPTRPEMHFAEINDIQTVLRREILPAAVAPAR